MIKRLFPLLFLCLFSCTQEELLEIKHEPENPVIVKSRPHDNPWIPFRYDKESIKLTRAQETTTLNMRDYLGYSFQLTFSPIEDINNIGGRIIDIAAMSKEYPAYFTYWQSISSQASSFTYSNFSEYSSHSEFTHTLTSGIDFKLFGFNLTHKRTHINTFGETISNDNKSVFGELNIVYKDSTYRMSSSPLIKNIIIKKYLDPTFLLSLHADNPYQCYLQYGALVAFNYSSGGRATAIYTGVSSKETSNESRENDLKNEINASYNWNNNSAGADLSIGRKNGGNTTTSDNFTKVLVSVKTLGGMPSSSFSPSQDLSSANIDLSSWIASLSDRARLGISAFNQNGLLSISDFIIEENLKELYNSFINGQVPYYQNLVEPYILLTQIPTSGSTAAYEIYVVTRFGKTILLARVVGDTNGDFSWLTDCQNAVSKIFKIKVVREVWYPASTVNTYAVSNFQNRYYSDLFLHPEYYKKLSNNGILYMIDEVNKIGFSIYNNAHVIKEYGLTEFISSMSSATISYSDMIDEGYKLNAL